MLGLGWTHVHETFGFIPGSLGIWYPSQCWPFNKRNFKLNSCLQCGNKSGKSWCQSEPILGARSPVSDAIRLPGARHVLLRPRPGFFPSNCVQGWRCSPSAAAPGLLARLRTLLAFAPRQVNLVVVRDKGSPNCKHISMMFNLGAAHMNRRGWTGGVRSCWPTSLSWWGWWWLCLSW